MAAVQLRALLQHLRRLVGPSGGGALTDAHLLERFVNERDEAAFEVLVWRHGPMVLSVCRRVLRQEQDAEDAFQATFLTFVRKARSISKRQALASWLSKVAYRVALEAKTLAAKRKVRAKQDTGTLAAKATQPPTDPLVWTELRAVLDEEVNRLPEKYRTPLVLCYFEGKTYQEAARELGCPKGTISIRLMRARELLRPRLARRGLALSGGMLAAVLSENATAAAVSKSLVEGTVKASLLFAAGKTAAGVFSAQAVALTEGVLKAMFVTKLKIAAALLLAVSVTSSGAGLLTYRSIAGEQASPQAEKLSTPPGVERQEQKAEPTRPVVRTKEDKLKSAAETAEPQARMQQERRRQLLAAARANLHSMDRQYDEQERRWIKQLVDARLRTMQAEDKLRLTEREQDPLKSPVYSQYRAAQNELNKTKEFYLDKDHPRLKERQETLRSIKERWMEDEGRRGRLIAEARREFVEAEEDLRFLERQQSFQREIARRRVEAAEARLRWLEEDSSRDESPKQDTTELTTTLNRVLRELAELRREIRRQQTDKSEQPPRRSPDQP